MDKDKKTVFKSFALISQLGISVMVPIAMCVAVGILIDRHFGTVWVIPLLFLGILAGGRNAYKLAMSVAKEDEDAGDEKHGK